MLVSLNVYMLLQSVSDLWDMPANIGKLNDIETFDSAFFSASKTLAGMYDPSCRLMITTAYEAILDAGE